MNCCCLQSPSHVIGLPPPTHPPSPPLSPTTPPPPPPTQPHTQHTDKHNTQTHTDTHHTPTHTDTHNTQTHTDTHNTQTHTDTHNTLTEAWLPNSGYGPSDHHQHSLPTFNHIHTMHVFVIYLSLRCHLSQMLCFIIHTLVNTDGKNLLSVLLQREFDGFSLHVRCGTVSCFVPQGEVVLVR